MIKGYIDPIVTKLNKLKTNFDGYSLTCFNDKYKLLNVSPGPTQIPNKVLNIVKTDIFSNYIYGVTPFEISHRSPEFNNILENTNNKLREFMKIPEEFEILWTQAGGHGQFCSIPLNMNYLSNNKGNYLVTGTWSNRAYIESTKFTNTYNSMEKKYENSLPLKYDNIPDNIEINDDDSYLYLCSNETVNGTEFRNDGIPYPSRKKLKDTKLIVDMSSDFGMKSINWNNIDVAFACTSKNFGISGANITIIRNNLLKNIKKYNKNNIPCVLDWNLYHESESLYNTPAIFNIYLIEKLIDYYLEIGGIQKIEEITKHKSKIVYDILDNSKLYKPVIQNKLVRSNINIPFIVGNGDNIVLSYFLNYCYNNNIVGLRTKTPFSYSDFNMIEPLRISLYNGISIEDTEHLVSVMKKFEEIFYMN
tara:strand:+ start:2199 stop:3455 length:1257 start_codon:yes stop_codon:yes gene_type:complete